MTILTYTSISRARWFLFPQGLCSTWSAKMCALSAAITLGLWTGSCVRCFTSHRKIFRKKKYQVGRLSSIREDNSFQIFCIDFP